MNTEKVHLTIATRNAHKTREFVALLGDGFAVDDLTSAADLPLVEETGLTFAENAIIKALAASREFRGMIVADDSGLEVDALGGVPGVYSARYAGIGASDTENVEKLLGELRAIGALDPTAAARFRCVLALAAHGELLGIFEGSVEGAIVSTPRGSSGFGYDPVFVPHGFSETFAELAAETKNQISHRAAAVAAMRVGLAATLAG